MSLAISAEICLQFLWIKDSPILNGFASLSLSLVAYSLSVIVMALSLDSNEQKKQGYLSFAPKVPVEKLCGHEEQADLTLLASKL